MFRTSCQKFVLHLTLKEIILQSSLADLQPPRKKPEKEKSRRKQQPVSTGSHSSGQIIRWTCHPSYTFLVRCFTIFSAFSCFPITIRWLSPAMIWSAPGINLMCPSGFFTAITDMPYSRRISESFMLFPTHWGRGLIS